MRVPPFGFLFVLPSTPSALGDLLLATGWPLERASLPDVSCRAVSDALRPRGFCPFRCCIRLC